MQGMETDIDYPQNRDDVFYHVLSWWWILISLQIDIYIYIYIDKVETFIHRIRWKAHFFDSPDPDNPGNPLSFGFRSNNVPPKNSLLTAFENDLYNMVQIVEFRYVNNDFLNKLAGDTRNIKSTEKLLVFCRQIYKPLWNG